MEEHPPSDHKDQLTEIADGIMVLLERASGLERDTIKKTVFLSVADGGDHATIHLSYDQVKSLRRGADGRIPDDGANLFRGYSTTLSCLREAGFERIEEGRAVYTVPYEEFPERLMAAKVKLEEKEDFRRRYAVEVDDDNPRPSGHSGPGIGGF